MPLFHCRAILPPVVGFVAKIGGEIVRIVVCAKEKCLDNGGVKWPLGVVEHVPLGTGFIVHGYAHAARAMCIRRRGNKGVKWQRHFADARVDLVFGQVAQGRFAKAIGLVDEFEARGGVVCHQRTRRAGAPRHRTRMKKVEVRRIELTLEALQPIAMHDCLYSRLSQRLAWDSIKFRKFATGDYSDLIRSKLKQHNARYVWGIHKSQITQDVWSQINIGDEVFLGLENEYFNCKGSIVEKVRQEKLAGEFWPDDFSSQGTNYLLFFNSLTKISIPFSELFSTIKKFSKSKIILPGVYLTESATSQKQDISKNSKIVEFSLPKKSEKIPDKNKFEVYRFTRDATDVKKLKNIDGIGEKTISKIYESIVTTFETTNLETLMAASNLFGRGMGVRKSKLIVKAYPNIMNEKWSRDDVYTKV